MHILLLQTNENCVGNLIPERSQIIMHARLKTYLWYSILLLTSIHQTKNDTKSWI